MQKWILMLGLLLASSSCFATIQCMVVADHQIGPHGWQFERSAKRCATLSPNYRRGQNASRLCQQRCHCPSDVNACYIAACEGSQQYCSKLILGKLAVM